MSETVEKAIYDEVLARARKAERRCSYLEGVKAQLESEIRHMRNGQQRAAQLGSRERAMRELFGS